MFCVLLTLCAALAFLVAVAVIFVLSRCDADLALTFRTKFGKQPESLAGKVVWVTGASSGIGEHVAYCLAKAGCKLVLSARRKEELERVKAACVEAGKGKVSVDDVLVVPLDVTKYESHKPAVQQVLEYFNKIDILVNNAGKSQRASWVDVELNVDHELFEVNALGPVSLTQAVLPHMMERKEGHIAVVSSLVGKFGTPCSRSYAGSKFAVLGFFESLRTEVGQHNIGVTLICPGPVFSNLFIYAATGKKGEMLGRVMDSSEKRMTTERCAYLSCVAIANRSYEVWITLQPILWFVYLVQYIPDLGRWFSVTLGIKQIMKMRDGKE